MKNLGLISVCLCTFKRPHVVKTIASLLEQKLPPDMRLEIIVVDNDKQKSAQQAVEAMQYETVPVRYYACERQNIAAARNESLKNADGEWIAFIDDDEIAQQNWLMNLFATQKKTNADAVVGNVIGLYPPHTPAWIKKADLFSKTNKVDCQKLTTASTCNILVKKQTLTGLEFLFDEEYGLTGGEDAEIFSRIFSAGGHIVASPKAIVTEIVEDGRLNMAYLKLRAIRGGECYARIYNKSGFINKIGQLILSLVKIMIFVGLALVCLPFGKPYYVRFTLKAWASFGRLKVLCGCKLIQIYN
ncbi:MAG: glycosyltransferase family 2 protein [Rhizobiales bacterium]|nr:glycosyltransferase [Hyphomicrobiales bacterium]NRB13161.1 glycosyltransferase family 2 protein [Hyphomicrobiales bacterium]